MTKSTQWVRVWSCWSCNLTHRKDRSVMEGEREETESVCWRCPAEPLAVGLFSCYSPLEQSRVWHSLPCTKTFSVLFFTCNCCHRFTICSFIPHNLFNSSLDCLHEFLVSLWITDITFTLSFPFLFPLFCLFSTLLRVFHHLKHSSVGLSLFGLHVKEHDVEACVSPANTSRAQYFFVLPPLIFVFAQT